MRILWVKIGGLWPANSGGRLRSYHIVSELSRRHEVSVMTTHQPGEDPRELARHLPHCRRVESFPHAAPKVNSPRFVLSLAQSWLTPLPVDLFKNRVSTLRRAVGAELAGGDYDLCVTDFLFAVPNVPTDKAVVPVVFFAHNVEYMIWRRLSRNDDNRLRRLLLELEWRKMRRYETAVCRRADLTIAVSGSDRDHFHSTAADARICAIPTGVDTEYFRPNGDADGNRTPELVFTGSMDWHPNEDAILYFIDAVLPAIRREVPGVAMTAVGRNPGPRLRAAAARAGVRVTGTVEDIRPYVNRAAVYVVPLRIGGGTRLKIYEALAMGKAVVSTSIGAEGLPLKDGTHFLCADEPAVFAAKVVDLLREPPRRRALGRAGRQLVEESFTWARVAAEFEARCREAAAR